MKFSYQNRPAMLTTLQNEMFDLVIIGGGITGAGVAVQAAASGLKTALIEMQDFSEGTSSRSTKLVHGGIRYLKQGQFDVVADTVSERAVVQQIAPHIPRPTKMLMPLYDEPDPTFTPLRLKVAMDVYDSLAGITQGPWKNETLTREEVLQKQPNLNPEHLVGGGLYLDFENNDSRLVIENIKQAFHDGATLVSHVKAVGFEYDSNGKITAVQAQDLLGEDTFSIKARLVINTTGPWSDTIRQEDTEGQLGNQMRPTKGVHLVVDRKKLDIGQPTYFDTGEQDGRMVFVIPREDKTYFGTTDTDYDGDLTHPTVTEDDVDYLLRVVNRRFSTPDLTIADIESSWAGLRPLIAGNNASDYNGGDNGNLDDQSFQALVDAFHDYAEGTKTRNQVEHVLNSAQSSRGELANDPSAISRGSDLSVDVSGLLTLAGGKITDYRKMAEGAMEKIIELLAEQTGKTYTLINSKTYPVSGGRINPSQVDEEIQHLAEIGVDNGLSVAKATELANLYGSNFPIVLTNMERAKALTEQYDIDLGDALSLLYTLDNEMVIRPTDFFTRRTRFLHFKNDEIEPIKAAVTAIIQDYTAVDDETMAKEADELERDLSEARLDNLTEN